ncbi:MAG: hypothetical protein JNK63_04990 [Chthonomonas sp.]|nr:hypothetical protein [Chthonomonas sp.]
MIDLAKCLSSGQVFRWREVEPDVWEGFDGSTRGRFNSANFSPPEDPHWHRFFRLDEPLDLQSHLAQMCPKFAALPRIEGFRLLRPSDPVESFFSFLCTSNNHLSRIAKMVEFLFSHSTDSSPPTPSPLQGEGVLDAPLTSAGGMSIPTFTEPELRAAGFGYRAATIPQAAKLLIARGGRAYLQELRQTSLKEVQRELLSFPGVGPKLTDCIALYALHNTEAVPVDVHLWNGAVDLYFPDWRGTTLTAKKYEAIGDHFRTVFGPWAGHAHLFVYYADLKSR